MTICYHYEFVDMYFTVSLYEVFENIVDHFLQRFGLYFGV